RASGLSAPRQVRLPIAAPRLAADRRSPGLGDLGGAVGRAVVDDDYLAGAPRALDSVPRLVHDDAHGLLLVEARHDHRNLRRRHAREYACLQGTAQVALAREPGWRGLVATRPPRHGTCGGAMGGRGRLRAGAGRLVG